MSVYYATTYLASDITYTTSKNSSIKNIKGALDDLYSKGNINVDYSKLKLVSGEELETTTGKTYLIAFSVTSASDQNYAPSIVSGCEILCETNNVTATYSKLHYDMKSYIVKATADKIVVKGNTSGTNWNGIAYY